jgi:hypothetical protein
MYSDGTLSVSCSQETRDKISKSKKGKSMKRESIEKRRNTVIEQYKNGKIHNRKGKKFGPLSQQHRRKIRESAIDYYGRIRYKNKLLYPNIGKHEKQILDLLETLLETEIERQYQVCGYFVDGYSKNLNTVFEVDEPFHFHNNKMREEDIERQNEIYDKMHCYFLRIPVQKEVKL